MTKMKHAWFPVTLSFVLTHSSDRFNFNFSHFELYFALHSCVLSTFQQHLLLFPSIILHIYIYIFEPNRGYCLFVLPCTFSLPICPALGPKQADVDSFSTLKSEKCLEKCFDPHCGEKDEQRTCDGLVSCYWCKKDKDGISLSKPYCGTSEKCFRGTENPVYRGKKLLNVIHFR